MYQIKNANHQVWIGDLLTSNFTKQVAEIQPQKIMICVDENTVDLCLPYLLENFTLLHNAEIMVLPQGEEAKDMEICMQVWATLTDYNFQRGDLIINLGGGVVTDMGGFVAAVYKRGLSFINIPTTLLAMIDASVGGKTGVNLNFHKNQLGVFAMPIATYCDPVFLNSLANKEIMAGKAEMLKHGLIADKQLFDAVAKIKGALPSLALMYQAIGIKSGIVARDFKEKGERKKLNFGHTIGHALEGMLLHREVSVTHGECVAWGMLAESYLSTKHAGLPQKDLFYIEEVIRDQYIELPIQSSDFEELLELMQHDKKNSGGGINFTLLKEIGESEVDFQLGMDEVLEVLGMVF